MSRCRRSTARSSRSIRENPTVCASPGEWHIPESWPPIEEDIPKNHGTVLVSSSNFVDSKNSLLVVVGGEEEGRKTDSVRLLEIPPEMNGIPHQWRQGPPMNRRRSRLDAVVCNGAVYAIGGNTITMERIETHHLSKHNKKTKNPSWRNLSCRLSKKSIHGAAAALNDRYIVIMTGGGKMCNYTNLKDSVDIMDTRDGDPGNHTLVAVIAPKEHVPRYRPSTLAVGNKVYLIGGCHRYHSYYPGPKLDSVECIEFDFLESSSSGKFEPKFLSWKVEKDLYLRSARHSHMSFAVGNGIVVYGGTGLCVELLDLEHRKVVPLPEMRMEKSDPFVVVHRECGRLLALYSRTIETMYFDRNTSNCLQPQPTCERT